MADTTERMAHLFGQHMLPISTTILAERLRLRRFTKTDIPFVFSASRFPGFCDGMQWSPPKALDELIAPYEANERAWSSGGGYTFTIEDRFTAESLGRASIRRHSGSIWDLGFWIHPLHQGNNYMSEAVVALIAFGFEELGASQIQAAHATWNVASRRVLEKAGLKLIKHISEGYQKEGRWVAEDLLSVSVEQWKQENRPMRSSETSQASHHMLDRSAPGTDRAQGEDR